MIDITSKTEDGGFADIVLSIENYKKDDNGNYTILTKGKYKDTIVGLEVFIKGNIKKGIINGSEFDTSAFKIEGITLKSIGEESNNLVKAISELYGSPTDNPFSQEPLAFTSFALEEHEVSLEEKYTRFKVFFDDDNSRGLYFELFINVNIPTKELEIHEKDVEYRQNILKTLTS
jgi:hypothetical protein